MEIFDIAKLLSENSYPGRGIVVGRSTDDKYAVIAYFIMGRSENSRNRIFTETEDGIRTEAFDPSKMVDPSLIIYHPVRVYNGATIVTNGDQTDTVRDGLAAGKSYIEALRTRQFEPDGPNYTPRISAVVEPDGAYEMSILKSFDGDPACNKRFFFEYDAPRAGIGHFIHTYMTDGSPLPSFEGEPETVRIEGDLEQFTETVWTNLNADNKVSLYTSFIDLETGEAKTMICNKHVK
jgi:hypothetical protein